MCVAFYSLHFVSFGNFHRLWWHLSINSLQWSNNIRYNLLGLLDVKWGNNLSFPIRHWVFILRTYWVLIICDKTKKLLWLCWFYLFCYTKYCRRSAVIICLRTRVNKILCLSCNEKIQLLGIDQLSIIAIMHTVRRNFPF